VDLHRIYDAHKDKVGFLTVYIAEAHPDDEWQMDSNREDKVVLNQPRSPDERRAAAAILVDRLAYRMPVALDSLDNRADRAFAAWPERIYILGQGGRVLYKGGMGPFGFDPGEAEKALASLPPS
jgi:Iodothyronine deiodinase